MARAKQLAKARVVRAWKRQYANRDMSPTTLRSISNELFDAMNDYFRHGATEAEMR